MTKAELIATLEKRAHLTYNQAEMVVNTCFYSIVKSLYDNEKVELRGFGSFGNKNYKAYQGRNPRTGEIVEVPPKKVPFFKISAELRKKLNGEIKNS